MTVFHKIVAGELPAYVIAEDENHLAFLDIFPTHYGQTVIIPKIPATSKFSEVPAGVLEPAMIFAQKVAKHLESRLENILRCEIIIEGFEIDYFHIKVLPVADPETVVHKSGPKASGSDLEKLKQKLTI